MRTRALGIAILMFGLAGVLASFGLWWMLYRYGKGIGDAAGVHVACTQHCGGVDGSHLIGVVASAALALIGLSVTAASSAHKQPSPKVADG